MQKTRKTTAKIGGLCEERSENCTRKKSGEKRPTSSTNGKNIKLAYIGVTTRPASPLQKGKQDEEQYSSSNENGICLLSAAETALGLPVAARKLIVNGIRRWEFVAGELSCTSVSVC